MTEKKVAGKKSAELKRNFDKGRRVMSILYLVLVAIVILVLVRQFFTEHYEHCFTCLLTLVLFLIPTFVERKLKITLPNTLEVIIILFIFAAEILGEIRAFYLLVPWWDTMLHTMNGFLMAAIGVSMVDILNQNDVFKFQLSPFFVALVAFCFVLPAVAADALASAEWTTSAYEKAFSDVSLVGTAAPYFALILAAVPVVLDAVFERKEKKDESEVTQNG